MSSRCSKSGRNSKKVDEHEAQIETAELVVVMADECHLLAGDSCGYGWGKSSERLVVQVTNAKQRQTYFGALNPKSGELIVSEAAYANSETTVCFLETLRGRYPGKQLWVIWDNASYHKSQKVQAYLEQITWSRSTVSYPASNGRLPCLILPPMLLSRIRLNRCGCKAKRKSGSRLA